MTKQTGEQAAGKAYIRSLRNGSCSKNDSLSTPGTSKTLALSQVGVVIVVAPCREWTQTKYFIEKKVCCATHLKAVSSQQQSVDKVMSEDTSWSQSKKFGVKSPSTGKSVHADSQYAIVARALERTLRTDNFQHRCLAPFPDRVLSRQLSSDSNQATLRPFNSNDPTVKIASGIGGAIERLFAPVDSRP